MTVPPYYPYEDFVADALKIRDDIAGATGVALEFGQEEYDMLLDMIRDIDASIAHLVADHDELAGLVMAHYDFRCDEEYTAFKRLIDKYYERVQFYSRRAMDERNGRYAPTPPIEAYER